MADNRRLEDILKMDDRELRDWHTARLYEIGQIIEGLPCRTENMSCNAPSRIKKVSIWSAVGVFAGSSVVGFVLGILNWLGRI
jgi:hypothetical protein